MPAGILEYWQKPESELTAQQRQLLPSIQAGLIPDLPQLARESAPSVRLKSVNLAGEVRDLDERLQKTIGYRTQINYQYWKTLAQAEQEERTVKARRLIYEAEQANDNAELDTAIELYEQAFVVWAEIFDDYPLLTIDDSAEDLFESVRRYMIAIDSQEIPEDFPLATFVTMMGEFGQVDSTMYEAVRAESKEAAKQRKIELEEEEKKRQEEAEKAEAAEGKAQADSGKTEKPVGNDTTEEQAKPDTTEAKPEATEDDSAAPAQPEPTDASDESNGTTKTDEEKSE